MYLIGLFIRQMIRAYGGIQTVLRRKNGEKYMEVPGTTTNSKKERMMQSRMELKKMIFS